MKYEVLITRNVPGLLLLLLGDVDKLQNTASSWLARCWTMSAETVSCMAGPPEMSVE